MRGGSNNAYLLVPILLISLLLSAAVIRGPSLVSSSGLGSAVIVAAPLIFATYALMSSAVAGRGTVDLAVGPLLAFINVSLVKLNGLDVISSPLAVFAVALGIGVIYQVLFALVIIYVRVQPIIVALSGFLALSGINRVILPRPGGTAPDWMGSWGIGNSVFSPILLMLALATGGWLLFTATTFYRHLRLMGYDERSAYSTGVRINLVRIGAHIISGIFVGLGAICYTALISSGDPTQGTTLSLTAVTAVVLGGVSLGGGRGGVTGALLGAVNLFLIGYVLSTFNFGTTQAFVTQLCYGVILVLSLVLTLLVPIIGRYLNFISPFAAFMFLGCIVVGIMLDVGTSDSLSTVAASAPAAAAPAAPAAAVPPAIASAPGAGHLLTRYLLLPPDDGGSGVSLVFSPLQKIVFGIAAFCLIAAVSARVMVVEAMSRRFGPFLYVVVGVLILLLLFAIADQSRAWSLFSVVARQP